MTVTFNTIAGRSDATLTAYWLGWLMGAYAATEGDVPIDAERQAKGQIQLVDEMHAADRYVQRGDEVMADAAQAFLDQLEEIRKQDDELERWYQEQGYLTVAVDEPPAPDQALRASGE